MNELNFNTFITKLSQNLNISDYGFVPLTTMSQHLPLIEKFSLKAKMQNAPEYVTNSLLERLNPLLNNPEAKTLFICAVPFNSLPQIVPKLFQEAPEDAPFYGLIANYATYQDYHYEAKRIMTDFIANLQSFLHCNFGFEIFADTSPVAERFFASLAKIGYIGKNHCLKPFNAQSSSFLCGFICDIELPQIIFNNDTIVNNCNQCQRCISRCPNQILTNNPPNFNNCISSISMEQRQFLVKAEREKLHHHIFGCSRCSTACFNSSELDFKVDLEWLLTESAGKLKKVIKQTALNYAGITLLRRNSLAVLENFGNNDALQLIKLFGTKTQSELLQKTCINILENNNIDPFKIKS